jgi:hypothetical protein
VFIVPRASHLHARVNTGLIEDLGGLSCTPIPGTS